MAVLLRSINRRPLLFRTLVVVTTIVKCRTINTNTTTSPDLVVRSREGSVAVVELNRPKKRNALSQELIDVLIKELAQLDRDTTVRVVVLTGVGQGPFRAGADLSELVNISTAEAFRIGWLKDLNDALDSFRKPIIAAVRGFAFGGGFELALLCDMIFASTDARFGFPEISLGTIPDMGGTQRLTKTVGKQKALELVLTGTPVTAKEIEQWGVVNRVTSADEDVFVEALTTAQTIAARSASALRIAKHAVKAAETTSLKEGLEIERASYYGSFSFPDYQEGIAGFLKKRPAKFLQH